MGPPGDRGGLGRTAPSLAAVAHPVAVGAPLYPSPGRGWPWSQSLPVGLGVLWVPSLAWAGRPPRRRVPPVVAFRPMGPPGRAPPHRSCKPT